MTDPKEERWNSIGDITKDLARLDDFGADYENFTREVLTSRGRGIRKREESPTPKFYLDPRTGEPIEPVESDEAEDEFMSQIPESIKAELKASKNGCRIGRGTPISSRENDLLLKKQLRSINSQSMSNHLIEEYVRQEAEKRSAACSKKDVMPSMSPLPKKDVVPPHSSNSPKKPTEKEHSRPRARYFGAIPKEVVPKVTTDVVNRPRPFPAPAAKKRSNRNALISSLLQQMEKNSEEDKKSEKEGKELAESLKELSLKRSENDSDSKIFSEITDDDVVIGSEVENLENNDLEDELFRDFKPKKKSFLEDMKIKPKAFSDLSQENENDILEFKNEFLKNFIEAQEHLDIGKNAIADLEKKKIPKNSQTTRVFTNSKFSGNNDGNNNDKIYEKLAEKVRKEKNRKKIEGGIYDIKPDPFFLSSRIKKAKAPSPPRAYRRIPDENREDKNFNFLKDDFPSLS